MNEIINKVANSSLITIDLKDFYPKGERVLLDIKGFLFEEIILKEKEFRNSLKEVNWSIYLDKYVAINCSTDAILPSWAYLLITTYLQKYAKDIFKGSIQEMDEYLFIQSIENKLILEDYAHKKVIIKGCSDLIIPENCYIYLVKKLSPIVSSLMYGEACSTVPLIKNNTF